MYMLHCTHQLVREASSLSAEGRSVQISLNVGLSTMILFLRNASRICVHTHQCHGFAAYGDLFIERIHPRSHIRLMGRGIWDAYIAGMELSCG